MLMLMQSAILFGTWEDCSFYLLFSALLVYRIWANRAIGALDRQFWEDLLKSNDSPDGQDDEAN